MKYQLLYKDSVEKDFRRLSKNKKEREKIKAKIEFVLSKNPYQGKELKGIYRELYSLHLRYKIMVVYKIFKGSVLILAIEPREGGYKRKYYCY